MIQTSLQISDAICPYCNKIITRTEFVKDTENYKDLLTKRLNQYYDILE